jgi:hypothetical protein
MNVKYIITKDDRIIVFSALFLHSDFKRFEPKSAGFISIGVKEGNPTCSCYGESISLGLKSRGEDTEIAKQQLDMIW